MIIELLLPATGTGLKRLIVYDFVLPWAEGIIFYFGGGCQPASRAAGLSHNYIYNILFLQVSPQGCQFYYYYFVSVRDVRNEFVFGEGKILLR